MFILHCRKPKLASCSTVVLCMAAWTFIHCWIRVRLEHYSCRVFFAALFSL